MVISQNFSSSKNDSEVQTTSRLDFNLAVTETPEGHVSRTTFTHTFWSLDCKVLGKNFGKETQKGGSVQYNLPCLFFFLLILFLAPEPNPKRHLIIRATFKNWSVWRMHRLGPNSSCPLQKGRLLLYSIYCKESHTALSKSIAMIPNGLAEKKLLPSPSFFHVLSNSKSRLGA